MPAPKHRLASPGCIADALVKASSASPKRCFSIAAVPLRARAFGSSSVRGPAAATEAASISTAGAIRRRVGRVRRGCARRTPWRDPATYWCSRQGAPSLCISGSTKVAPTAAVGNVSSLECVTSPPNLDSGRRRNGNRNGRRASSRSVVRSPHPRDQFTLRRYSGPTAESAGRTVHSGGSRMCARSATEETAHPLTHHRPLIFLQAALAT